MGSWKWAVSGNRVEWSKNLCNIYGLTSAEAPRSYESFLRLVHPDDLEMTRRQTEQAFRSSTRLEYIHRVRHSDGSTLHLSTRVTPVRARSGKTVSLRGTCRNVTRYAQVVEKLVRAKSCVEVLAEQKSVAHDIRNLLQEVVTGAELVRQSVEPPQAKGLEAISRAACQAAELTRRLISAPNTSAENFIEIGKVLRELEPLLRGFLPAVASLEIRTAESEAHVAMDQTTFERLVINLVLNARDSLDGPGTIGVTSRVEGHQGEEGEVVLAISDSGSGMSRETRQRVFEPGFSLRGSSGLGLSQVATWVASSGGRLKLTSELGQGSVFRIHWPAA